MLSKGLQIETLPRNKNQVFWASLYFGKQRVTELVLLQLFSNIEKLAKLI
jgi:hypothetical protein